MNMMGSSFVFHSFFTRAFTMGEGSSEKPIASGRSLAQFGFPVKSFYVHQTVADVCDGH
jgi:hypothetical protein